MKKIKIIFLFLFILFGVFSLGVFTHVYAVGDIAGDMLTANRLRDEGYLLVGHWSVWQFNHPGPFWFYYNRLFEIILTPFSFSRLQEWFIASLLFNATVITFSARSLSYYFFERWDFTFSILFAFLLCSFSDSLSNLWMPYRIITPYLAFLISLLLLTRGKFNYIFPAVFFACILIHGYAIMPFFTLPFIFIAFLIGYKTEKNLKHFKIIFIASFLMALFFASPIIIDFILNQPDSNLNHLLSANQRMQNAEKPELFDILFIIFEQWITKGDSVHKYINYTFFFVFPLLFLFIFLSQKRGNLTKKDFDCFGFLKKSKVLLLFCFLIYATTILYFKFRTPAPFIAYAVNYLTVLPPLIFITILTPFYHLAFLKQPHFKIKTALILIFTPILFYSKPAPDSAVVFFENNAQSVISTVQKEGFKTPLAISTDLTAPLDFIINSVHMLLGVLVEFNEQGIAVCLAQTADTSNITLTKKHRCPQNMPPEFLIIPPKNCGKNQPCLFKGDYFAMIKQK